MIHQKVLVYIPVYSVKFLFLLLFSTSEPCMMLILNKENAVEEWRALMGPADPEQAKATCPNSMRARFASDILHNSLHGASSEEQAREKIHLIFGDIRTDVEVREDGDSDSTKTGTRLMLHVMYVSQPLLSCVCMLVQTCQTVDPITHTTGHEAAHFYTLVSFTLILFKPKGRFCL